MSDCTSNAVQQFIDKSEFFIQQDANWNVIGVTDHGCQLVERFVYSRTVRRPSNRTQASTIAGESCCQGYIRGVCRKSS